MEIFLLIVALIIIVQSLFTIFSMIYAWDSQENLQEYKAPATYHNPSHSFTILLPAWQEEAVIGDTITALSKLNYPLDLTQILILLRPQDQKTIEVSEKTLKKLNRSNLQIVLVDDLPRNKPNQLNWGLREATGDIVTVFDAEDEPSRDILNIVNSTFIKKQVDLVQCGVQLMNFRSNWFSTLNVLEYYFWFKSSLLLFAKSSMMPLGGNSVFIKKELLMEVGGWNEDCLTEDADLGVKLSRKGAKMTVIYDPLHTTHEETPDTTKSFIQQRTRWVQGFFQIFKKGEWLKLNSLKKILLCLYVLLWPMLQILFFFYLLLAIFVVPFLKIGLPVAIISVFPLFLLLIQIALLNIGLWNFTRDYKLKYPFWMLFKVPLTFIPYQIILGYSALRALWREIGQEKSWEKTKHTNIHRQAKPIN
jgi:glycosyltransferase XagB